MGMLKLPKFTGVRIISYSILVLSLLTFIGFSVSYLLAPKMNLDLPQLGLGAIFSLSIAVVGILATIGYLKKKRWGRISLLFCCVFYFVFNTNSLIKVFQLTGSISWAIIFIQCICLYGTGYLLTAESKEWLSDK